jgi:hypothetical protein
VSLSQTKVRLWWISVAAQHNLMPVRISVFAPRCR